MIKKAQIEQKIVISALLSSIDEDDDSEYVAAYDQAITLDSLTIDTLKSDDDEDLLSFHMAQVKEGFLVHLYFPQGKADSVHVKFDLKFTFLKVNGNESSYSFEVKEDKVYFSNSLEAVKHIELTYFETPFCEPLEMDNYLDEFDNVTIKCTGKFSRLSLNSSLATHIKEKEDKIGEALPQMLQSGRYSDVKLVASVSGKEFPVHKSILASFSPVFDGIFEANLQKGSWTNQTVLIGDISTKALQLLLKFIYNDICFADYLDRPYELLDAAIKYGLKDLKDILLEVLSQFIEEVNPTHLKSLHTLAVEHHFEKLEQLTIDCMQEYAREQMLSMIYKPEELLKVVDSIDGLHAEEGDESSIEKIFLKSENMKFKHFRVFIYSSLEKKYTFFWLVNSPTLSFKGNYLLITHKQFVSLTKRKSFTTRLDITKCIFSGGNPNLFINNYLYHLVAIGFGDTSNGNVLYLGSFDKHKLLDFHQQLMTRVGVLQTSQKTV